MPATPQRLIKTDDDRAEQLILSAKRTLSLESQGLRELEQAMNGPFAKDFQNAAELIRNAKGRGRVIITGMGKSGHIGQKVAATLASTGTPAFFVHPSEASHGDLGMITSDDVVLGFSWSGETVELANLINFSQRFSVKLIAVTSNADSTLAKAADVALVLPKSDEACPHGLAPTTSTTMQLALGDCLAIALLESKGFSATDFKTYHPGGQLGAALNFVSDIMHETDKLPLVESGVVMSDALVTMTEKSFGCLGVVNAKGELAGIITDGDLRRHMGDDMLKATAGDIMTPSPKTTTPDATVSAALELVHSNNITALFVVENKKPVGIIHIHDLLRLGVA